MRQNEVVEQPIRFERLPERFVREGETVPGRAEARRRTLPVVHVVGSGSHSHARIGEVPRYLANPVAFTPATQRKT